MTNLPHISLVLHIIGLATVAGTTLSAFVTRKQFWNQYSQDKQKGFAVMQALLKLSRIAGIGLLLLIISGVTMVAASGGIYGQQLWFKIKMMVVLLIIATSIFMTRALHRRLDKFVQKDMTQGNLTQQIGMLTNRIGYVQLSLLAFFVVIFVLSVFRFN
ncbi:MAG TPA: hypothetical protein VG737_11185 [Cyclobacteriaceae bacterium]|nr:hypothetical protein [Cyclobacteriaceae bacterium]